jgi:hypothetical protein
MELIYCEKGVGIVFTSVQIGKLKFLDMLRLSMSLP